MFSTAHEIAAWLRTSPPDHKVDFMFDQLVATKGDEGVRLFDNARQINRVRDAAAELRRASNRVMAGEDADPSRVQDRLRDLGL